MFGGLGGLVGGLVGGPAGAVAGNVVGGLLEGKAPSFDSILGDQMVKGGTGIMSMLLQPMLNDLLSDLGEEGE